MKPSAILLHFGGVSGISIILPTLHFIDEEPKRLEKVLLVSWVEFLVPKMGLKNTYRQEYRNRGFQLHFC